MLARAAAILLLAASTAQAQGRPRKIFISVDLEGISGVVQPAQLGPDGFEYQRAREWMTDEVNAAIAGIREAGAAEILVCDSHGNGQSVLIDKLPDDVRIVRGFPRPLEMMQGIDETFSAAVFIGYHASEWTADAVRGHTISSARLLGVKLNGAEVSEGIYNAALAGQFGVPVAFVSGDRLAVTQLQQVAPSAEGAIVKEPYGYHSALTVTPARGQSMIRTGGPALPRYRGAADAEVVIIGGGLTGCATAYAFAVAGVKVVLLEAERLGRGSSGSSAGWINDDPGIAFADLERARGLRGAKH